jgi:hypothetical protein
MKDWRASGGGMIAPVLWRVAAILAAAALRLVG